MLDVKDLQKAHGAVFTSPAVVDLILDLAGYTEDKPLYSYRLLDPAVGDGAFLIQAVSRLISSYEAHKGSLLGFEHELTDCIRGVEVNGEVLKTCRTELGFVLAKHGFPKQAQETLMDVWLVCDDFLLWDGDRDPLARDINNSVGFDFVVGNPPYVRQELVPDVKMAAYRSLYSTIYDRADLYVPFIQHGLQLLNKGGVLAYICADRFMRNRYGKRLREYIVTNYQLRCVIDVHKTSPFADDVSAYPAIFVVANSDAPPSPTHIVSMDTIDPESCSIAKGMLLDGQELSGAHGVEGHKFATWVTGDAPWILESVEHHDVLRKIEARHPLIEDDVHGIKIGIGVATGADRVYIVNPDEQGLDVEPEVLLPLVTTKDIVSGHIQWGGQYVINPFLPDGSLIDLGQYPKLKRYFDLHGDVIRGRNVAKKSGTKWYRTIDRIYPELLSRPKLLIPDVKADNHIVKDSGRYYPHHNLYYVLPGVWDIDALRAVLLSSVVRFFIWSYAVKMRGDFLRYQAQYLRRIRVPAADTISTDSLQALKAAASSGDRESLDRVVADIYGLTAADMDVIRKTML